MPLPPHCKCEVIVRAGKPPSHVLECLCAAFVCVRFHVDVCVCACVRVRECEGVCECVYVCVWLCARVYVAMGVLKKHLLLLVFLCWAACCVWFCLLLVIGAPSAEGPLPLPANLSRSFNTYPPFYLERVTFYHYLYLIIYIFVSIQIFLIITFKIIKFDGSFTYTALLLLLEHIERVINFNWSLIGIFFNQIHKSFYPEWLGCCSFYYLKPFYY